MKLKEIATRMTGFSTPVFGLQWQPATVDSEVAQIVISFLEDRGVLFETYE